MAPGTDIFVLPVRDSYLLYAPLRALVALVDRAAVRHLTRALQEPATPVPANLQPLLSQLAPSVPQLQVRTGAVTAPLFLGIIPTRGCNMACAYCDFAAPKQTSPLMDLPLARTAVDAYLKLLPPENRRAAVHFFGGEPFFAANVIHFVVAYATLRAAERGVALRFEVTTNGLYGARQCRWIGDHFDTVVLSLDGLDEVQNRQRPTQNGRATFATVAHNARILSESTANLVLRACITQQSVADLVDFAHWVRQNLLVEAVCFETLIPSPLSIAAAMSPPDPWTFAQEFDRAAAVLTAAGIEAVLSTAVTTTCHLSFCPVGQDALIVTPDGAVNACYLLPEQWQQVGLDMRLGQLQPQLSTFALDDAAVQRTRQLQVNNKPRCADCFCRYHCAGGCHVNHDTAVSPGTFDAWCIQTRLVTMTRLLRQLGQHDLAADWLADRVGAETAVYQSTDRLLHQEI